MPTITVCAAAKSALGTVVKVQGEFGGFGYATNSMDITVTSPELCSDRGAGLLFVGLLGKQESDKLLSRRPPGKRDGRHGDAIEVQGVVSKVADGRFTYLKDAVVIR